MAALVFHVQLSYVASDTNGGQADRPKRETVMAAKIQRAYRSNPTMGVGVLLEGDDCSSRGLVVSSIWIHTTH